MLERTETSVLESLGAYSHSRVKGEPWILEGLRGEPGKSSSRELRLLSGALGCSWPGEVFGAASQVSSRLVPDARGT